MFYVFVYSKLIPMGSGKFVWSGFQLGQSLEQPKDSRTKIILDSAQVDSWNSFAHQEIESRMIKDWALWL